MQFSPRRLAAIALLIVPLPAYAQSAENVAVVINERSADSQRIGEYYARARQIPDTNVFRIQAPVDDEIDRSVFDSTIADPVGAAIKHAGLQDRLLFIVLTKGVPLRVRGTSGLEGTGASVDSELTLLYRRLTGQPAVLTGTVPNPYFLAERAIDTARPFSHREHDIYLVTRLDGFSADAAISLVDRAQAARPEGRFVLDQRATGAASRAGDEWMTRAAARLAAQGQQDRVVLETTPAAARDLTGVLGRYAWGSVDAGQRTRRSGMTFVPGAIAATLASFDARTFRAPPDEWQPVPSKSKAHWFEGSTDGLAGDLIQDGATGVSGQVGEAFLKGAIRPDILFPAYVSGFTLAEAFYLAQPVLGWQAVVVGDPLCAPFGGRRMTRGELEDQVDAGTGLPVAFSRRRLAVAGAANPNVPQPAIVAMVRAIALLDTGNDPAATEALREALVKAPRTPGWLLQIATLFEQAGAVETAIATYRELLELQPSNVVALNNIAFALAEHAKSPAQALPFANRAVTLAPGNGLILDTVAWIEHLLGNHDRAAKLLEESLRLNPREAEIHLHAAIVYAALGARERSAKALDDALRLNPNLESRGDVRELRARITPEL
jgi:uncharacterized protein (TIGR03790 family)